MTENSKEFQEALARHTDPSVRRLYHGSPHEFSPGDIILPASKVGKEPSSYDVAYATPDLNIAHFMAWEQNNHNGNNFNDVNYGEDNPPPEHVYEVEPVDPKENLFTDKVSSRRQWDDRKAVNYAVRGSEVLSKQGFKVIGKVPYLDKIEHHMRNLENKNISRRYKVESIINRVARNTKNPENQDIFAKAYFRMAKEDTDKASFPPPTKEEKANKEKWFTQSPKK